MSMSRVEIVKIKLPEDVTARFSLEAVRKRIGEKIEPVISEFIKTGFDEMRAEFHAYVNSMVEKVNASSIEGLKSSRRMKAVSSLVHAHPDNYQRDRVERGSVLHRYWRLSILTLHFTRQAQSAGLDEARTLRKLLILEYLRTAAREDFHNRRKIVFRGNDNKFGDMKNQIPGDMKFFSVTGDTDIESLPGGNDNKDSSGISVIMVDNSVPEDIRWRIGTSCIHLMTGGAVDLLRMSPEQPELKKIRLLQLDTDVPSLMTDSADYSRFDTLPIEEVLTSKGILVDHYRKTVVDDFNAAILSLMALFPKEGEPGGENTLPLSEAEVDSV